MRVLFTIHHHLDPNSGAPGVTWQLARAMRAAGHEAEIYSWDDLPPRLGPRAREALFPEFAARRMARADVDVIDAASCDAWLFGLIRRPGGPTLVSRSHGLEQTFWDARAGQARRDGERIPPLERIYHGGVRLREARVSMRRADAVLFLNRADRERAVRELRVAAERAYVIANGIPDELLGLPAPAPSGDGPLRLAQIGSWAARKGAAVLVEALRAPLAEGAVTLTLVGTAAPAEQVLGAFPAAARERVRVVPSYERAELPALLAEQHSLLLPSYAEGFSLALVEGMACGLAPIATAVGAAPDLIADEGLLVPAGDAAALADAIRRVAADRPLLDRMRAAAQQRVQEYSWPRVAAHTLAIYERARA
jgi:glycosyltransferase involved in cell wall biosynthesis